MADIEQVREHVAVLAIHGIGDARRGYSDRLQRKLRPRVETGGRYCDPKEAFWSNIPAEDAQNQWMAIRNHALSTSRLGRFLWAGRMPDLRLLFYRFAADVLVYLGPSGVQIRGQIEKLLRETLRDHEWCHGPHYLDVVGHSLGTIIAYDLLSRAHKRYSHTAAAEGPTVVLALQDKQLLLRHLFTMGSPLALMNLYSRRRYPRFFAAPVPFRKAGAWLNFRDLGDPLALPLEALFNRPGEEPRFVEDVVVRNTWWPHPHRAHTGYWRCGGVSARIANTLEVQAVAVGGTHG